MAKGKSSQRNGAWERAEKDIDKKIGSWMQWNSKRSNYYHVIYYEPCPPFLTPANLIFYAFFAFSGLTFAALITVPLWTKMNKTRRYQIKWVDGNSLSTLSPLSLLVIVEHVFHNPRFAIYIRLYFNITVIFRLICQSAIRMNAHKSIFIERVVGKLWRWKELWQKEEGNSM